MKKVSVLIALVLAVISIFGFASVTMAEEDATLRVGVTVEPTTICELNASSSNNTPFTHLLYDTLVYLDSNAQTVTPGLADSWEIAEDSKSVTMHLNPDAKAIDGSAITANDVLYSFRKARDCGNPVANLLTYYDVENFEIIDDHTIVLKTYDPFAEIVTGLGNKHFAIYSESLMEAAGGYEATSKTAAAGTGPYKLVEWVEGDHITVERNEYYHGKPGYYKTIIFYFIGDPSSRTMSLQSGDVDYIHSLSPAMVADVEGTPGLQVIQVPSNSVFTMFFNAGEGNENFTPNPALKDARVRKAIAYAINKDALVQVAYNGYGKAADSCAPSTSPYYTEVGSYYDPEASKALLAEAGYAEGLTLDVLSLQVDSKICEILQNQLAQVGVTLELSLLDVPQWIQRNTHMEYDIFLMSRFGSQIRSTVSSLDGRLNIIQENYSAVDDPAIYADLDIVMGSTNIEEGKEAYARLMEWNKENFAILPLVETTSLYGAKDTIDPNVFLDYCGMHTMYGRLCE
ncbi:MAG: ABC transporter substrate-binding protein [Parasporobacterium sp.]|nr:ABC transporter substrate-binding protein [Parasporobacterium sp.]